VDDLKQSIAAALSRHSDPNYARHVRQLDRANSLHELNLVVSGMLPNLVKTIEPVAVSEISALMEGAGAQKTSAAVAPTPSANYDVSATTRLNALGSTQQLSIAVDRAAQLDTENAIDLIRGYLRKVALGLMGANGSKLLAKIDAADSVESLQAVTKACVNVARIMHGDTTAEKINVRVRQMLAKP
jgi:hypothetical protein